MIQIAQGAEAKLFRAGSVLIKRRIRKGYRVEQLDTELRKARTRREARLLDKLHGLGVLAPGLVDFSDKAMEIRMDYLEGERLSTYLSASNASSVCPKIGKQIARLHSNNIIHGDLTTSNMILVGADVYFIDFGLSFYSTKGEDKAVDLHVLKQALESRHYALFKKALSLILGAYKKGYRGAALVLRRLEAVEKRGRYR